MDILPALKSGSLVVVFAQDAAKNEISHIVAELALRGPITVLDGGNRLQAYRIAHLLRGNTADIKTAASRLFIRRAFTCYQMLALLEDTPALRQPFLVLDLLSSFYDDHVSEREAQRLLQACMHQFDRLCQVAPVAVTLGPPLLDERAFLVEAVCALADKVFMDEEPVLQEEQLTLF